MSARTLLEELAARGVELRVDDTDHLEYEGPEDVVTPELLDRLRQHKTGLVSLLTEDCGPGQETRLDPAARKLQAAGWKPKGRLGKTIWERPDNGFYVSEEIALILLERQKKGTTS